MPSGHVRWPGVHSEEFDLYWRGPRYVTLSMGRGGIYSNGNRIDSLALPLPTESWFSSFLVHRPNWVVRQPQVASLGWLPYRSTTFHYQYNSMFSASFASTWSITTPCHSLSFPWIICLSELDPFLPCFHGWSATQKVGSFFVRHFVFLRTIRITLFWAHTCRDDKIFLRRRLGMDFFLRFHTSDERFHPWLALSRQQTF